MTDRDYLAEVNAEFPFDERSEARLLAGGFASRDPQRLRGVRHRPTAAAIWAGWQRSLEADSDESVADRRRQEAREALAQELHSLARLADDALRGSHGPDARVLARRLLVDDEGNELPRNLARLRTVQQGLRRLRAASSVPKT